MKYKYAIAHQNGTVVGIHPELNVDEPFRDYRMVLFPSKKMASDAMEHLQHRDAKNCRVVRVIYEDV